MNIQPSTPASDAPHSYQTHTSNPAASDDLSSLNTRSPQINVAEGKVLLLNHPRSCGTVLELFLQNVGFQIEVNPFDYDYYFVQKRGESPPKTTDGLNTEDFGSALERLTLLEPPQLIRAAGYTLAPHLEDHRLPGFLKTFEHVAILVRDPAYSLVSHRQHLEMVHDSLTEEEAGYKPLLALAKLCRENGIQPKILEAHEIRNKPFQIFETLGLSPVPVEAVQWQPGMRDRWSQWASWKAEVSESTQLKPFVPEPEVEAQGKKDPLYESCQRDYEAILAFRSHQAV